MLNFDFLEKGIGIVSPPYFVYNFSRKVFLILYSINWPNFIVWLPLHPSILGNMCTAIVYFPDCDIMNFEINLIFLIKHLLCMVKIYRQKYEYTENRFFKVK